MMFLLALLISQSAFAVSPNELCPSWATPAKQGETDSKIVDESSGLVISRRYDSLYHMNDSGTGPEFHISKLDGSSLTGVQVEDFKPVDPEDLTMGPCAVKSAPCLVIADIGDNRKARKDVTFVFIEELASFPRKVKPDFKAVLQYPDGSHNAESAALLDNGDLIVITKEMSVLGVAQPALVFRSKRMEYLKSTKAKPAQFQKTGELDLPSINLQKGFGGIATGMTSLPDGQRFTVLTYTGAIEFSLDLKAEKLPVVTTASRRIVPLFQLPQQESITYDKNDRDLVYSTEIPQAIFGAGQPAPIYKVKCAL